MANAGGEETKSKGGSKIEEGKEEGEQKSKAFEDDEAVAKPRSALPSRKEQRMRLYAALLKHRRGREQIYENWKRDRWVFLNDRYNYAAIRAKAMGPSWRLITGSVDGRIMLWEWKHEVIHREFLAQV